MRICIVGKFPPIEGGVCTRTYWTAHALAARGHEVHVVTNAKEVRAPYRMLMRAEDWQRCEASYGAGSVSVHWSDPVDVSQVYAPMASPFVSKLAGIAADVHSAHPFDVILSHYLEPYGVAAHLAAQMTGLPHVARMAGSDAGKLWHHPQLAPLYDHVLRSAEAVVAVGPVAERAVQRGVEPGRIVNGGPFTVPEDVFTPFGDVLDLSSLRTEAEADRELHDVVWGNLPPDMPYIGIYGKLGESKGSFALLAALQRLKQQGVEVGLVALAHGGAAVQRHFRARASELGLAERVLQLPFLPNWRVPEFIRGCLAVCCLEQGFPIAIHAPIIAREVLLCAGCLVGSTEIIRKLPGYPWLPDGYGCAAIPDVQDTEILSRRLAAIVQDPETLLSLRARGHAFAHEFQQQLDFPETIELVLERAAAREGIAKTAAGAPDYVYLPFARMAQTLLGNAQVGETSASTSMPVQSVDIAAAQGLLEVLDRSVEAGRPELHSLAVALRIEVEVAAAEARIEDPYTDDDPLFRLRLRRWMLNERQMAELIPARAPHLHIVMSEYDASKFIGVRTLEQLPAYPTPGPSYIAVFARSSERQREPMLIDEMTAQILRLSNGIRTVSEIIAELNCGASEAETGIDLLKWFEPLFQNGLLWLSDEPLCGPAEQIQP